MIGSVILSLPWAFQQAGLIVSIFVAATSFLISFYTCNLIVHCTGDDIDFFVTIKKYFGKFGYYAGLISSSILILGAIIVLFIILA